MYCGSCLRDNRIAATLIEQGRDVVLMPLYTPLRTDEQDVSTAPVHYGGLNVYLQQQASFFRHLPAWLHRMFDSPRMLNFLSKFSGAVDARSLGPLTVSVLKGENGAQQRELSLLIDALVHLKPDIIHLPTLPFIGAAQAIKDALGVPIFCTLSGEDIFLDELLEPHRTEAFQLIREKSQHIEMFVATSHYYAQHCREHFALPADRLQVVPMGIRVEDFEPAPTLPTERPFTIGYLARICPEKGLANLCDAFSLLCRQGRDCRLRIAGFLAGSQKKFLDGLVKNLDQKTTKDRFEIVGELSRRGKVEFLQSLDVLSVPSLYREAKGLYVLEALACGVPVVEPRHGSFPELIDSTGGGLLFEPPQSVEALANSLAWMMDHPSERREMGVKGREAVLRLHNDRVMADQLWSLYERTLAG